MQIHFDRDLKLSLVPKVWYSKTETLRKVAYCMVCNNFFIQNIIKILELKKGGDNSCQSNSMLLIFVESVPFVYTNLRVQDIYFFSLAVLIP